MIVMKFGGTSVEDAAAMSRVAGIVSRVASRRVLVVVSACAGVTNDLIRIAGLVRDGSEPEALQRLDVLRRRHQQIVEELGLAGGEADLPTVISEMFLELQNFMHGIYLLGELTNRSLDMFTSFGERLSSLIFSSALRKNGVRSCLIDARRVMVTDRGYGSAQPIVERVEERVMEIVRPGLESGEVGVTQGFIGATEDGITTTIGRGGSDLSAAIFGAALGAEEIQIWTDVDGMMSADPRVVPDPRRIGVMSFNEASELAYFGAKVLHPRTILPAIQKNIPVRVLNSRRPDLAGTLILGSVDESRKHSGEIIKSIAFKKGITVINVSSSRMLMAHGFLARLFSIFAEHRKSVDVVATSEVSVSLTVDSDDDLATIVEELRLIGDTRVTPRKAIICIVGEGMRETPGIAARLFGALGQAKINIEMVSEGASEINLTLVVDETVAEKSVRVLHAEFFGAVGSPA